jgi:hypothetical protein
MTQRPTAAASDRAVLNSRALLDFLGLFGRGAAAGIVTCVVLAAIVLLFSGAAAAAPDDTGDTIQHRDTHFAFLEHVAAGEAVCIETPRKTLFRYRVVYTEVVHKSALGRVLTNDGERLTLVTCYPFRAINPRGPLRYVVTAVRV